MLDALRIAGQLRFKRADLLGIKPQGYVAEIDQEERFITISGPQAGNST